MKIRYQCASAGLALAFMVSAQAQSTSDTRDLGTVTVVSPRVEQPITKVPYAIDLVGQKAIQRGTQQLGLDESLNQIPGIFMLNRYNFAQDLRIAIRGFGARAAFGIRGIQIIADGIPLTLPDGQGGIDQIDLASAERIEVIRGPASSLYGNASGGVINIITEKGPEIPFIEGRYSLGSYGFQKYNLKTGGQTDKWNYLFNIGRYEIDGYRDHAGSESVIGNGKFIYDIDNTSDFTTVINFVDSPRANDPGGLTLQEARDDREQARDRNVALDAGETKQDTRIGFVYRKEFTPRHEIRLRNFYSFGEVDSTIPIVPGGIIEVDRLFAGGGAQYTFNGDRNRLIAGVDVSVQDDDRIRFDNLMGAAGPRVFDQNENVSNLGVYLQNEFSFTDSFSVTTGVRYDKVEFEAGDHYLADGRDDSGEMNFDEVSPLVGFVWSPVDSVNFYGNVATSFETPTTSEFANPANMGAAGGFNPALSPQESTNYELGVKGFVPELSSMSYSLAVFHIDTEDELVPFQLAGNDRDFFRNAGESQRRGVELALSVSPLPHLTTSLAYTYSDFEYERYVVGGNDFSGNTLPGIPKHFGNIEILYDHPSGYYAAWNTLLVGSLFADDANNTEISGYGVSNIRAGFVKTYSDMEISPFIGINNIFDKEYFTNIRLNAFGGRYYEPAPEINVYAGISIRHNFL